MTDKPEPVKLDCGRLIKARELASDIEANLPLRFEIAMLSLESKIPFKLLTYREALIHRFSDTATAAVDAVDSLRPVSAALLTRASMETLARMKEFKQRLERFLANPQVAALDEFAMNRLFGSRNDPDLPNAANILTSVDEMKDTIPSFRTVYDNLSEYCHPNHQGTFGSFARIDRENFVVEFSDQERCLRALNSSLLALIPTCELFGYFYNESADLMRAVNNYFEKLEVKRA